MTDVQTETHFVLWLLLAFALGTFWEPVVELAAARFGVDNRPIYPRNPDFISRKPAFCSESIYPRPEAAADNQEVSP